MQPLFLDYTDLAPTLKKGIDAGVFIARNKIPTLKLFWTMKNLNQYKSDCRHNFVQRLHSGFTIKFF